MNCAMVHDPWCEIEFPFPSIHVELVLVGCYRKIQVPVGRIEAMVVVRMENECGVKYTQCYRDSP